MSSISEGVVPLPALTMLAWSVLVLVVLCVETAGRRIEEDARRHGERVIWHPINRQGD